MNRSPQINSFVSFLAAVVLANCGAMAASQPGSAKFVTVTGSVLLDSVAAKVGDVATTGNTITTGPASRAKLDLKKNGPDVVVDENSSINFTDLEFDDSGSEPVIVTKIGLQKGSVSGVVDKLSAQSQYVVTSPTTTAAIRGTTYTVTAEGVVYVFEGSVDVTWRDPSTGRLANFNVSQNQMFDPGIPGVVEIPVNTKPPVGLTGIVHNRDITVTTPTGPITVTSPISGK